MGLLLQLLLIAAAWTTDLKLAPNGRSTSNLAVGVGATALADTFAKSNASANRTGDYSGHVDATASLGRGGTGRRGPNPDSTCRDGTERLLATSRPVLSGHQIACVL